MLQPFQDQYYIYFHSLADMMTYHQNQAKDSQWTRTKVKELHVAPLDESSVLFRSHAEFGSGVSEEAVNDTAKNLGLALRFDGEYYPMRETAYKSLLDRAKIGGTVLSRLSRGELSGIFNACLKHHPSSEALLLIRNEKVSAVHSGDERDYSILPIDGLMDSLKPKLDERFPGNSFDGGYSDHSITSACWSFPAQREELLDTYEKTLTACVKFPLVEKLTPGIRFTTSDTGVSSAKISAMLLGLAHPIHIGSMVAVEHRRQSKIEDFQTNIDMLFAQFGNLIKRLTQLTEIYLDYPVNTMTAICKKLSLPKKAAMEAIAMFEMAYGGGAATAHDVFMAMQEILFILKTEDTPVSKMLIVEEAIARTLTMRWPDYDLAKVVGY